MHNNGICNNIFSPSFPLHLSARKHVARAAVTAPALRTTIVARKKNERRKNERIGKENIG